VDETGLADVPAHADVSTVPLNDSLGHVGRSLVLEVQVERQAQEVSAQRGTLYGRVVVHATVSALDLDATPRRKLLPPAAEVLEHVEQFLVDFVERVEVRREFVAVVALVLCPGDVGRNVSASDVSTYCGVVNFLTLNIPNLVPRPVPRPNARIRGRDRDVMRLS
jgi:hypothetical protein